MAASPIQQALMKALETNPNASNDEVAAYIRSVVPNAQTTGAAVSSMKSRLRSGAAAGLGLPGGLGGDTNALFLPDFSSDPDVPEETIDEAKARISVRYKAMERMADRITGGGIPSLVISGPPGMGKSNEIKVALAKAGCVRYEDYDGSEGLSELGGIHPDGMRYYDQISGSITAVGLYQALWNMRKGGIVVLDDCDDVFRDETSLNLLKAALDSTPTRHISWRKEARWLTDYGIDKTFDFQGHVVFLTNIDFEQVIAKGHRDAEHFKALIDRSMYLCLTLRTRRDFMIRIRQVSEGPEGMIARCTGLTAEQAEEVLDFVAEHQERFYNLSLRLILQIANCMKEDLGEWRLDVEATKMRTR